MSLIKKYSQNLFTYSILLVIIASISGCKKNFLDRRPLGQYTTDNYPYPSGGGAFDQYIFAAYADLRDVYHIGYVAAVSIRSDDADKGSTPSDLAEAKEMDDFPVSPINSLCEDLWTGYFATITDCNIVLDQVTKDEKGSSEQVKLSAQAEARFLRGYSYFMLVRLFGDVPIVDSVLNGINASNIAQSPASEVYAFIEKDLQFAAANLPLRWDTKFIGRVTSGASNSLLSKVYLYEKKWQLAMSTAEIVISSGVYDLKTPYDYIFTEKGENSSGSIFEIQAYADANHTSEYGCAYGMVQGIRSSGIYSLGWGFNDPSLRLVNAYEPEDPREGSTILFIPTPQPTRYGEMIPSAVNPRYNMKVYTDPEIRKSLGGAWSRWTNVRILRYSDVLLMYAEAANELGQSGEALTKLEMVRTRARNGNNSILPPVTTTDQFELRDAIRHERRIELAMENDRFFDIVRWGIADDVLHTAGKMKFSASRDALLPIPQTQIDLSKGVLKQNPGY